MENYTVNFDINTKNIYFSDHDQEQYEHNGYYFNVHSELLYVISQFYQIKIQKIKDYINICI